MRRGPPTIGRAPMPSSRARRIWRSASRPPTAGRCCLPTTPPRVIGAAHAGWRGAFTGVIEATFAAMEKLGADRDQHQRRARARPSGRTITKSGRNSSSAFWRPMPTMRASSPTAARADHAMFDLTGYIAARVQQRRHCEFRRPRPLHLCRARALLQFPPLDPSERAGLRPPHQRHRAWPINGRAMPLAVVIAYLQAGHGRGSSRYALARAAGDQDQKARPQGCRMQRASKSDLAPPR